MYTKLPGTDDGRIHNISSNDTCISESVGRAEKYKFIDVLYECNLMCSNTDAQLLLLKSCRRFIESYCLSGSLRRKNNETSKIDEAGLQRRGTITVKKSNSLGRNTLMPLILTKFFIHWRRHLVPNARSYPLV